VKTVLCSVLRAPRECEEWEDSEYSGVRRNTAESRPLER